MTEDKNFLSRWSRRKLEAEQQRDMAAVPKPEQKSAEPADAAPAEPTEAQPFDPATLPTVESIDAATDIRDFLKTGVPAELTRAALRRVWTSDPAIRDFIEIAENQWDFANASSIPGFGDLEVSEEMRRIAMQVMDAGRPVPPAEVKTASAQPADDAEELPAEEPVVAAATVADEPEQDQPATLQDAAAPESVDAASPNVNVASQHEEPRREYAELPFKRSHGRALPE
jgi:hypothetical protein